MLDIDNRVGPLVIGFYLQIIGDGTIYMPLYKVGNLYSHYSVLPSSLEIEGRSMDMQMHEIYSETLYLIFDYPYKYYTFKLFEV